MTINGLLDSACVSSNIQIDNKIRLTVHPNFIPIVVAAKVGSVYSVVI